VTALEAARSALFVPGDRPGRFDTAAATGALVVLDLKDAVAEAARPLARGHVRHWLEDGGQAVVRVQAASAPGHAEDVDAVEVELTGGGDGLLAGECELSLDLRDGRTVSTSVSVPPGAPARPPTQPTLTAKVRECAGELPACGWDGAVDLLRAELPSGAPVGAA